MSKVEQTIQRLPNEDADLPSTERYVVTTKSYNGNTTRRTVVVERQDDKLGTTRKTRLSRTAL